jgi:hypothetical protein
MRCLPEEEESMCDKGRPDELRALSVPFPGVYVRAEPATEKKETE